ncbi:MAG: hypothetical protein MZV65_40635 [Chromatiales bacterium]|nr:hypothetical protein [Chromatiales bacterium]
MIEAKRPRLELLDGAFVEKIVDEALTLLEATGRHGRERRGASACSATPGPPSTWPPSGPGWAGSWSKDALASTPSTVMLYDRSGEKAFAVGGDEVHFDPGSATTTILDHGTQEERKAATAGRRRLLQARRNPGSYPFPEHGPHRLRTSRPRSPTAYRLYLGLCLSAKPFVTGTFRVEGFQPMKDFLVAVRGGETRASPASRWPSSTHAPPLPSTGAT